MWRPKGSLHYLKAQADKLGYSHTLADRSRNNPEIYRVSVLLAQLCERYHGARKNDDKPVFGFVETNQIRATLDQCEMELQKLAICEAAAREMLAEAREAFGLFNEQKEASS